VGCPAAGTISIFPYDPSSGNFHGHRIERHTFITRLIKSGANPKTAQILARHHDASLTLNTYTHVELIDQIAALKALPQLDDDPETTNQRMQATGTEGKDQSDESPISTGAKSVDTYVDSHATFPVIPYHPMAQTGKQDTEHNQRKISTLVAMSQGKSLSGGKGKNQQETGFEPATFSLATRSSTS